MKYHVNQETGRAGQCKATKKGCPLGAETPHFDSRAEAMMHIEKIAKDYNSTFKSVSKAKQVKIKGDENLYSVYDDDAQQKQLEKMLKDKTIKVNDFTKVSVYGNFNEAGFTLSDGSEFRVIPNEGGCSCGGGDYDVTHATNFDKPIEKLSFDENYDGADIGGYSIYAFGKGDKKGTRILQVDGDDGSGYYGTGCSIKFTKGSN